VHAAARCLCAALGGSGQRTCRRAWTPMRNADCRPTSFPCRDFGTLTMTGRDSAGRLGPDRTMGLTMTTMSGPLPSVRRPRERPAHSPRRCSGESECAPDYKRRGRAIRSASRHGATGTSSKPFPTEKQQLPRCRDRGPRCGERAGALESFWRHRGGRKRNSSRSRSRVRAVKSPAGTSRRSGRAAPETFRRGGARGQAPLRFQAHRRPIRRR